ncbi:hypothetical protein [Flavobacterium filum]|uniref:hypothetical protein n=1 Tax=Flavobacterium filum TaxID=370974 RepID=UPI00047E37B1|nr:hypothetical protein [Flavobacterium filum]
MSKFHSVFFLFFFLVSCQYFEKSIPSEEELLQKRLKEINWNEVTNYPSVAECDSILDKEQQKACFFNYLFTIIHQKMASDSLSTPTKIMDTLDVRVTIFPDATLSFEPIFKKDSVSYDKQKIDSLIKTRLTDFPKIEPALKEGIPVKTQFILPVIIKME